MKFTSDKRPFMLCCCAIFCFAAAEARAQSEQPRQQQQPVLLALKGSQRELRVFDDGRTVESRGDKITERRLSESRMRKLREVIARRPCARERQQQQQPPPASSPPTLVLKEMTQATIDNAMKDDCMTIVRSYIPRGMTEIMVTIHSPDGRIGTIPVYAVCDGAKEVDKEYVRRNYREDLKSNWHRFIADASKAAGVKSFLKGCDREPF